MKETEAWDRDVHPLYEAWKEAEREANRVLDAFPDYAYPYPTGGLVELDDVAWNGTPQEYRDELRAALEAERDAERAYLDAKHRHHKKDW